MPPPPGSRGRARSLRGQSRARLAPALWPTGLHPFSGRTLRPLQPSTPDSSDMSAGGSSGPVPGPVGAGRPQRCPSSSSWETSPPSQEGQRKHSATQLHPVPAYAAGQGADLPAAQTDRSQHEAMAPSPVSSPVHRHLSLDSEQQGTGDTLPDQAGTPWWPADLIPFNPGADFSSPSLAGQEQEISQGAATSLAMELEAVGPGPASPPPARGDTPMAGPSALLPTNGITRLSHGLREGLNYVRAATQADLGISDLPPALSGWDFSAPFRPVEEQRFNEYMAMLIYYARLPHGLTSHFVSHNQLLSILQLPGSASVKLLLLSSILLSNTGTRVGALSFDRPGPEYSWNPHAVFQQDIIKIADKEVILTRGNTLFMSYLTSTKLTDIVKTQLALDLAPLAVRRHNGERFLQQLGPPADYPRSDGFELPYPGAPYESHTYYKPVSRDICMTLALQANASLPKKVEQLDFVRDYVNNTLVIWVLPDQHEVGERYDDLEYHLAMDNRIILPVPHNRTCEFSLFINNAIISTRGTKWSTGAYQYFAPLQDFVNEGDKYHAFHAWNLEVALSPDGDQCKIIVPVDQVHRRPPEGQFDHGCVLLRDPRDHNLQVQVRQHKVELYLRRFKATPFSPEDFRVQPEGHLTLPPLVAAELSIVPDLLSGQDTVVLEEHVGEYGPMDRFLALDDLRTLQAATATPAPATPAVPTPARLLPAVGAAGLQYVIKELTEESLQKMLGVMMDQAKYRIVSPRQIKAAQGSNTSEVLESVNDNLPPEVAFELNRHVLLLKELQGGGILPGTAILSDSHLDTRLQLVASSLRLLEEFQAEMEDSLLTMGLTAVLNQHNLPIDTEAPSLLHVSKSGSIWLLNFYLALVNPTSDSSKYHFLTLPCYRAETQRRALYLDAPDSYVLAATPRHSQHTLTQEACGFVLATQQYEERHESCSLIERQLQLVHVLLEWPRGQLLLVNGQSARVFLNCEGKQPFAWSQKFDHAVYFLPTSCSLTVNNYGQMYEAPAKQTSDQSEFRFLLAWNTEFKLLYFTRAQRVTVIFCSITGALILVLLGAAAMCWKFKSKWLSVLRLAPGPEAPPAEQDNTGDRHSASPPPSPQHPGPNPRCTWDLNGSPTPVHRPLFPSEHFYQTMTNTNWPLEPSNQELRPLPRRPAMTGMGQQGGPASGGRLRPAASAYSLCPGPPSGAAGLSVPGSPAPRADTIPPATTRESK